MRAVAILLSVSLLGCFPHSARNRTIAKLSEGGALIAGIGLEAIASNGADCDQMVGPGFDKGTCHTHAAWIGDAGVALILAGLLGFTATVSTTPDEKPEPRIDIKAEQKPAEKQDLKLPPGVTPPANTDSAKPSDGDKAPTAAAGGPAAHAAP
jgi:hypothetical protein